MKTGQLAKIAALAAAPRADLAACALRVQPGADKTRLIPAGKFDAGGSPMVGQGPWYLDEAAARQVIARVSARSTDIPIDYEHQTLLTSANGQPAPAAGWVDRNSLEWREDGLYGAVNWTAAARQAIDNDEYRYLSPVFPYAQDGRVLDLLHVALTNTPAINEEVGGVLAAARSKFHPDDTDEDSIVDREKLIAALGLATDATDQDIENAIAACKAAADQVAALRQELSLEEGSDTKQAVAALKTQAEKGPDMKKYVPRTVYEETQQQLAALREGGEKAEMDRLIDEGLEDGRIAGQATAAYLREQGLAALKAHLEDAPSVAALKGTQTRGKQPQGKDEDGELSQEELAVCKNMGLDPEQYRKTPA